MSQRLFCRCPCHALRSSAPRTSCAIAVGNSALNTARRTYFWPYPENLIPAGATTSSFQSSPVPSVRERVVREYALSPLFGRRTPCCVLGFAESATSLVGMKKELRQCIAQALGKSEEDVELGPLQQLKEMMLHRSGTEESPRLGDGPFSRPDAEQRRVSRYARLPVQARTVVEVYLPGEEGEGEGDALRADAVSSKTKKGEEDVENRLGDDGQRQAGESTVSAADAEAEVEAAILAHGWFLQEQLYKYMTARKNGSCVDGDASSSSSLSSAAPQYEESVAALHDEFGVVYCEVPAIDESGFVFDQLHGKEVDADMAARVVDRWTRRVAQQQQREANEKKKQPIA